MDISPIVRPLFAKRQKQIDLFERYGDEIQKKQLYNLLETAQNTEIGKLYRFKKIPDYKSFSEQVPLITYEELKPYVERMLKGENNLIWPSKVRWFAKSSGTTNDKSKFIPVSKECLQDTHYRGGTDAAALYLGQNPRSRMFDGKALILGGSHSPNYNLPHSLVGDLSAILIENVSPFVNHFRIPSKEIALLGDFEEKREKIARAAIRENVTNLSGVPSWMLSVLTRVMDISGKTRAGNHHRTEYHGLEPGFFHRNHAFGGNDPSASGHMGGKQRYMDQYK